MTSAIEYFCSLHPPNSFIEILTSTVTVFEGGDFIQRKKYKKVSKNNLTMELRVKDLEGELKRSLISCIRRTVSTCS